MSNISLMALAGTCGALISTLIAHQEYRHSLYTQEKWRMRDSYNEMAFDRKIFWNVINEAYEIHKEEETHIFLPQSLRDLLDRCGMPPGLLEMSLSGKNIGEYKLQKGTQNHDSLDRFVRKIYPPKNSGQNSIIQKRDFHIIRSKLSNFWDKWAERRGILTNLRKKIKTNTMSIALNDYPKLSNLKRLFSKLIFLYIYYKEFHQKLDIQKIIDEYGKEKYSLMMLTWLDYPYLAYTGEKQNGKPFMYILTEEIIKWHRLKENPNYYNRVNK